MGGSSRGGCGRDREGYDGTRDGDAKAGIGQQPKGDIVGQAKGIAVQGVYAGGTGRPLDTTVYFNQDDLITHPLGRISEPT